MPSAVWAHEHSVLRSLSNHVLNKIAPLPPSSTRARNRVPLCHSTELAGVASLGVPSLEVLASAVMLLEPHAAVVANTSNHTPLVFVIAQCTAMLASKGGVNATKALRQYSGNE